MLKAKATLTFRFYEDASGMQGYVPMSEEKSERQEGEPDPSENQVVLMFPESTGEAAPAKPANTGDPLNLTAREDGLCTGVTLTAEVHISKDQMKDLLDAEEKGLRPTFSLIIQG
jgi:hypothetical protein